MFTPGIFSEHLLGPGKSPYLYIQTFNRCFSNILVPKVWTFIIIVIITSKASFETRIGWYLRWNLKATWAQNTVSRDWLGPQIITNWSLVLFLPWIRGPRSPWTLVPKPTLLPVIITLQCHYFNTQYLEDVTCIPFLGILGLILNKEWRQCSGDKYIPSPAP